MALDIADQLLRNHDFHLVESDKYRAYNLLHHANDFVDNPGIGLDIAGMVQAGITDVSLESVILQYLSDFGCDMRETRISVSQGTIHLHMDFGGYSVHA